jgi:hypothetical protein
MSNVRLQQCNYGARMGREQERSSQDEAKIQQMLRIVKRGEQAWSY